ncbi:30S ribosomal protein S9 [Candidatus Roizmanbacteria bacterium RIFCSPHIGHO2_01_FULL_39_12b]|uniref:Small ribosomal subunit protein uS9 n=1 Tax=Candidatus Roizmanbacteria bacterium RIFCSPHIGHO2_01_FULL_39_12b TaxID=1802030 RepID=A0A1F7GC66_9BACT|nr:MAG: 30S ribosomal protein S9 [Candidatus Roizmanbacteria bacterium RIFCSPHIGHO2_01_FULL_39_12b]OGK47078.1 MAG: 30S ribosomal protein S9 [Candidatus Roizmanbacteria bacterium RIFCSPLOWO2_01_FULL_39_19]
MPKKKTENSYFEGIGRRKSAIARVRLYLIDAKVEKTVDKVKVKKGDFIINQKEVSDYFPADYQKVFYEKSLSLTNSLDRFAIVVKVNGGGKEGQLDAVSLGISRAMLKVDDATRLVLKKEGLLTRDARVRERRKVGTGGRARRKKQSPKR